MQAVVIGLIAISSAAARPGCPAPEGAEVRPVGEDEGVFAYRFERGDLRYGDILTLRDGSKHLGKAMEWATQVLLFDADGRAAVFDVGEVDVFEFRRARRHKARPDLPDLTVAYIERLPRDPSWHGHVVKQDGLEVPDVQDRPTSWHPAAGATVTFRVHVLNAGGAASREVPCRVSMDGRDIKSATIPPLAAGKEHVLELTWPWQEGRHTMRVEVDPDGTGTEVVRWNNTFVEPTDALAVTVVVAADRYEAFSSQANIVDSFCFEDWVQYQLRVLNALFAASVHPSTPEGVLERVRCDRMIVIEDPTQWREQAAWRARLHNGGTLVGLAQYAALWQLGPMLEDDVPVYSALKVDWEGLQGLAGQLGLIDLRTTDTGVEQCLVLDRHERYVQRRHLFPCRRTMMYTAGGFAFDERSAAFLNHARGRPRGFRGDFLYQLPEKVTVEVRSNVGTPLADVQVDVFQLMSEGEYAGAIAGYGRRDPLISARTGVDGRTTLANRPATPHATPGGYTQRPNPFGKVAVDGSNGLLLLRLRQGDSEEFHFLRLFDCNVAFVRGQTQECVRALRTHFGAPGAPAPPAYVAVRMEDRTAETPPMYIRWPMPPETNADTIEEFRVYRRTSFGGDGAKPWTLVETVRRRGGRWQPRADGAYFEEFQYDGPYSLDTFFAVSTVDRQGRESGLSAPGYLAYDKESIKLAMDNTGTPAMDAAYVSLRGDGPCQMIRWDGAVGPQPYGVRTWRFKGYTPGFAGIAVGTDGRLIVADPENHVLAFYDRGDLVELVPSRKWWPGFPSDEPGEFHTPSDVVADDVGNLYVADLHNHRVQVLDSRGALTAMLDDTFPFVRPHAVGYANGHLCVTDRDGTRCRVYDVRAGAGRFVRELPPLIDADRALVSAAGKVYVTGRTEATGAVDLLVFAPEGRTAVLEAADTDGDKKEENEFHAPRGLYLYRGTSAQSAYLVNTFPFDVRRHKLQ